MRHPGSRGSIARASRLVALAWLLAGSLLGGGRAAGAEVDGEEIPYGFELPAIHAELAAETLTWSWTFQDGDPASADVQHPSVTFSTPGDKTVTLTVCNRFGQCDTATRTVLILDPAPQVSGYSVLPEIALVGEIVTFASATDGGKGPLAHTWTITGGPTLSGNVAIWNTAGIETGSYPFSLLVANASGEVTLTGSLLVRTGHIRDWRAICPPVGCAFARGENVLFTLALGSVIPTLYEYDWDGDGNFDESAPVPIGAMRFLAGGTYRPVVRVTAGGSQSTLQHVAPIDIAQPDNGYLFADGFDATGSASRWSSAPGLVVNFADGFDATSSASRWSSATGLVVVEAAR